MVNATNRYSESISSVENVDSACVNEQFAPAFELANPGAKDLIQFHSPPASIGLLDSWGKERNRNKNRRREDWDGRRNVWLDNSQ
jgi:hypothetical protein